MNIPKQMKVIGSQPSSNVIQSLSSALVKKHVIFEEENKPSKDFDDFDVL